MQSLFQQTLASQKKRHYTIAFISFLMPLIWFFLPQLFEPLIIIKSYLFGATPSNANYLTLEDIALLGYLVISCLLGMIAVGLPRKKVLTIIAAVLGILLSMFSIMVKSLEISIRQDDIFNRFSA